MMSRVEAVIYVIDSVLDTKRKRHIVGGTLLSTALFFGGLAFTVMSIKSERKLLNGQ